MEQRYAAQGLAVLGVHTPEFDHEKERPQVERAAERYGLKHPIYMDNDYAYWTALGNHYWPSFYLVDRKGRVRAKEIGELHEGSAKGDRMEAAIKRLLEEQG